MGCRPSRHSTGRVGDSSWGNDKDAYFRRDSKKRKRMKNGCISQRKPAEFSEFSSTSKTYQRLSRNVSQCSKITLRLSTDGSTLEIEKYDIDFHSNKEELLTKNTEWRSSQDKPIRQINGIITGQASVIRSESAPQLNFLPSKLNTILEDGAGHERFGFRLFTNGLKPKSFRIKSKGKIKHAKTFANCTSQGEATENDLTKDQQQIPVEVNEKFGDSVDKNVNGALIDQQKLVVFDLVSEGSEISCLETSKHSSAKSEAKNENVENKNPPSTENNSKSIRDEKMLVESIPQNNYTGCSSNLKSSLEVCDTYPPNNDNADANSYECGSNIYSLDQEANSDIDLRIEVNNSINKFNEIMLRHQRTVNTKFHGPDSTDNETLVSVHASDSSEIGEANLSPYQTPSSSDNNAHLHKKDTAVEDTIPDNSKTVRDLIFVKGTNSLSSDSSITHTCNENEKAVLQDLAGNVGDIESDCLPAAPPTQLSTSEINEKNSCNCLPKKPESDISHDNELCKCCYCKKVKCYCAKLNGATDDSNVDNEIFPSCPDEIIHRTDVSRTEEINEGQGIIASLKMCNDRTSSKCDKDSIKNGTILIGISENSVQTQGSCDHCGELTTVATDRPLHLGGAVLTNKFDEGAMALCVKTSTTEGKG